MGGKSMTAPLSLDPTTIVIAPLLVALVTAILCLLVRSWSRVQRGVSLLGGIAYLAVVVQLVRAVRTDPEGTIVYQVSGWKPPYGITLVADDLTIVFLALAAVISLAALVFSVLYIDERGQQLSYHALYHFMVVGISGSFLTGDIFNLFVWFEVMLMSSYVLVVFYSGQEHTRAALHYTFLNLLGSAVMLLAIGGLYATTGTLNMADIARRLAAPAQYDIAVAPVLGLSALLFSVFALKSGITPFQFWVPDAYRAAPAPVAAMLAGVVKKVGIYAIIRLYFSIFAVATIPNTEQSFLAFFGPIILAMAVVSILLGGIGAVGRDDLDGLLAYSSIGQVGFIVLPLAVAATQSPSDPLFRLGIAAAIVYAVNHGFAKGMLFLVSGTVKNAVGSVEFDQLGGIFERDPVLSAAFFVGALTLIGIPPLSGFFGKLLVFDVAVRAQSTVGLVALVIAVCGAILTIAYFSLAWVRGFWGNPSESVRQAETVPTFVFIAVVLALAIIVLGVGFEPLYEFANEAAKAAIDTQGYVNAVLEVEIEVNSG
jgi:multicomponent Na+:H+ antiporter subunit D